ncbi:MAG: hypothetical protein CME63_15200 [Halobacteriovoraceae bacterium]|nr:hypothetical protein [Halobacteriovoraceae bacterium]
MIFKLSFLYILICGSFLFLFSGCNGGGDGFNELEDTEVTETDNSTPEENEVEIIIESIIPEETPVILKEFQEVTFGIQVNSGAGDVNYQFFLDNLLVQDGTSPFYILDTFYVDAGDHDLKVLASNSISEIEHIFNTRKNSKPLISLDTNSSQTINCISDTFTLSISAVDPDADSMSYSYLLNGSENSTYLSGTNTLSTAQVVFNPICAQAGSNTITIRATDIHGEYNDYSMAVTVTNPNIASIDSYSPTADPVVILSTETRGFLVSASGNPPLNYTWEIDPGSTLVSCAGSSTCSLSGGDLSPGEYTLTAEVSDSLGTSDDHDFNIVINDRPSISSSSPSNSSEVKMNCNSIKSFQVQIQDLNIADGQVVTANWYLDNSTDSSLTTTYDTSGYPYVADATFAPGCDQTLLGDHEIKVVISDGFENQEYTWNVETNYFSDACNNLDSGEICTLVGMVGMGSHLNVDTNRDLLRFSPGWITTHPHGIFFSDIQRRSVWFYNPNSDSRTVLGRSIPANSVVAMFGQNQIGRGTAGRSYTEFYLNNPRGLAYSLSEDALYVADQDNNRIIRFDGAGVGSIFAGGGSSNTDGVSRTTHQCNDPIGIALDESAQKLFVACNGNSTSTIKEFSTSINEGRTLIRYGNSAVTEGTTGYSGGARLGRSYALVKDPNSDILYAADNQRCRIVAISYGGTATYFGGDISLSANRMERLTFNNSCNNTVNRAYNNTGGRLRARDLAVYSEAGVTKGLFFTNTESSYIGFLNMTNSSITIGGNAVPGKYYHRIWGSGARDYGRGEPVYTASYSNYPYGIAVHNGNLIIGDSRNGRVGALDLTVGDGESFDYFGNHYYSTYDDETDKHANLRQLNQPHAMNYSNSENKLYFVDYANYRIRSVDLSTGKVVTEVGRGSGNSNSDPEDPLDAYTRGVYDLSLTNNEEVLLYTDYHGGTGTNRNCLTRAYNMGTTDETFFNELLEFGKVQSVGGDFVQGCQNWNASYENQKARSIPLRFPSGIHAPSDGSRYFMSDMTMHCVYEVDANGDIKTFIGTCGSSGNTSGSFSSSRVTNPGTLVADTDSILSSYGNFFIVERPIYNNSRVKYVNLSPSPVTILGQTINSNEVGEVIFSVDYVGSVASFENQICYSQGSRGQLHNYPHNVVCLDRDNAITSLRIGRVTSSSFNGAVQEQDEEEGVQASSASLSGPYGLSFDVEGNLYIAERNSNTIRMVKRWY